MTVRQIGDGLQKCRVRLQFIAEMLHEGIAGDDKILVFLRSLIESAIAGCVELQHLHLLPDTLALLAANILNAPRLDAFWPFRGPTDALQPINLSLRFL